MVDISQRMLGAHELQGITCCTSLLQRELSAFGRSLLFAGEGRITAALGEQDAQPTSAGPVSSPVLPVQLVAPLHPTQIVLM